MRQQQASFRQPRFYPRIHSLTVLFSVPLAALAALEGGDLSLTLYRQIGIILLMGRVTKNPIL